MVFFDPPCTLNTEDTKASEAREPTKTETSNTEDTKASEAPETTKSPEVKIEVKVIENQKSHDVIPPFLLGEVKYRPTEDEKE